MAKTEITEKLEQAIKVVTGKVGTFGCLEVTIGFGGNERVDYMTVDSKGIWRCYEIKTSLSDFKSKAKKSFVGHFNYFVLTPELFEKVKDMMPEYVGVYAGTNHCNMKCVKKPKKQQLLVDEEVLHMSMIRSLSRDATKLHQSENPRIIENFNRQINRLTNDLRIVKNENTKLRNSLFRKYGRNWQDQLENY